MICVAFSGVTSIDHTAAPDFFSAAMVCGVV
jgi:hypothetical protein